jgi:hypothetical protein
LISLGNLLFAQYAVKGKIIDERTKEPLAFVNVKINDNPHLGAVTDIDGNFRFESQTKIHTLLFSYVGYERKTIDMNSVKQANKMVVVLTQQYVNLQSTTIKAGENPADRIIRQVTANRTVNNPENVTSFRYISYNKIISNMAIDDTAAYADTIRKEMKKDLRGGHLLMMETATERKYRYPNHNQETVLGTKMSGFKDFSLAFLATDFQPFSFYEDHFKLIDVKYLSPISRGSPNYYFFNIEDTLYQNKDTIFVISFRPKQGKNINGLKGVLQIHTNKYAVQNVIAEPAEQGLISMKIQQKYRFVNDTQWFPEQLNFDILMFDMGFIELQLDSSGGQNAKAGLFMEGKCYIDSVELFIDLTKKDFSIDEGLVTEKAKYQDSAFWNRQRTVPLDSAESATYQFLDSIGEEYEFDRFMIFFEKLFEGKVPVKCFDIDLSKTLVMNEFEGLRLGVSIRTNEKVSKHLSLGGYFGYGFRDKQWKYGGELTWTISKKYETEWRISYQNTLLETGRSALYSGYNSLRDFRSFLASQMDQIDEKAVDFGFRMLKYAKVNVKLSQTQVNPLYDYTYQSNTLGDLTAYTNTSLRIGVRYAFKERFFRTPKQRLSLGTEYPIIHLNYVRGLSGFLDGDLDFNKIELRVDKTFTWKVLGESTIRLEGGMVDRPLPYGLLFSGEGCFDNGWGVMVVPHYFQTMKTYEFLSDQYANLFLSHNFGSLFLRIKKFQPHFILHHNMGWGQLAHPEYQKTIAFKTKDKGFAESGLQIDNILHLKYFGVLYLNFGVGAYYRYGAYAFDKPKDNFAFKISVTASTK